MLLPPGQGTLGGRGMRSDRDAPNPRQCHGNRLSSLSKLSPRLHNNCKPPGSKVVAEGENHRHLAPVTAPITVVLRSIEHKEEETRGHQKHDARDEATLVGVDEKTRPPNWLQNTIFLSRPKGPDISLK